MSTTTTPTAASVGELRLALDEIAVRDNVRELDLEHVDNLAQSIALRGVLVPLIVRATDDGWELVAGYHRIAACRQLGVDDVPVVVREREGSSADSAAENVTRKQLTPLEEARAVQAMLDEGYTPDGVAQALGWSRQLVTARAKILRLPAVGQQLVGTGEIPVSAIDTLLLIGAVSQPIAQALCDAIAAHDVAGSQLVGSPGWAIGQVLRDAGKDVFAAYLNQVYHDDLKALRLGKKADAAVAEAEQLHKQLDRYAYGPPTIRFSEADVDQARAAGVLIELDRSTPIVTDRPLYRELCKQAIARTAEDLKARVAEKGKAKRGAAAARERTPGEQLESEHRATVRELARQAHGTNLDLGTALLTQLATVAADDMDVARFFAYGLLGPEASTYGNADEVARTIAANGLRLVLDEHRTTTTPTLKSGARGKTKVVYCEPEVAAKWLWRFVDGAKSAGELYGRALVVFAAQHYASQLVLAASKRRGSVLPRSHKDTARKAFERVTKGVLPASHTQLQRAIAAEARAHERSIAQLDSRERADAEAVSAATPSGDGVDGDELGDGAGPDPADDLDFEDYGD
jgi:ParB/RepB/Spo0J family partition protein